MGAADDESTKWRDAVLSVLEEEGSSKDVEPLKVEKLRKLVLLSFQLDSDDKAAKKTFERTVQGLESEGYVTLDADGRIKVSKKRRRKHKDEKKSSKTKKKKTAPYQAPGDKNAARIGGEKRHKLLSKEQYEFLIAQADAECKDTSSDDILEEAKELAKKAGLVAESELPALVRHHKDGTVAASSTTGGHSNTNHMIILTGDYRTDRIAELRRNLLTRCRAQQPESRGEDKWDKPRVPGERRRRIVREKDLPVAPPEPPPSGYVVYLGQMTTKYRHERRHERHEQTKVVQEISRLWRMVLTDEEREYYNVFSEQVREEYKKQHMEFRATGHYTPSKVFERIDGAGLWVRKNFDEKNDLEKEIATYDQVVFPMRPPEFDDEHAKRDRESKERRKKKVKLERLQRQKALAAAKALLE